MLTSDNETIEEGFKLIQAPTCASSRVGYLFKRGTNVKALRTRTAKISKENKAIANTFGSEN